MVAKYRYHWTSFCAGDSQPYPHVHMRDLKRSSGAVQPAPLDAIILELVDAEGIVAERVVVKKFWQRGWLLAEVADQAAMAWLREVEGLD